MSALDHFGRRESRLRGPGLDDLVGASTPDGPLSLRTAGVGLGAGLLGVVAWRAHPVLGFLLASTVVGNAAAVAGGEESPGRALRRAGCVGVATAAALATGSAGFLAAAAWILGLVAADLVFGGSIAAGVEELERDERARGELGIRGPYGLLSGRG